MATRIPLANDDIQSSSVSICDFFASLDVDKD
jgi:hypothetical protein